MKYVCMYLHMHVHITNNYCEKNVRIHHNILLFEIMYIIIICLYTVPSNNILT